MLDLGMGQFSKCPVNNCLVTNGVAQNHRLSDYDAILINIYNANKNDLNHLFQQRLPHQRIVMFMLESPINDNFDYNEYQGRI